MHSSVAERDETQHQKQGRSETERSLKLVAGFGGSASVFFRYTAMRMVHAHIYKW